MRNLMKLFSVLMIMIGSFAFGQDGEYNYTKEEALQGSANILIGIKENTEGVYESSENYEDFRRILIGKEGECSTVEGENLVSKVYELHKNGVSAEQIIEKQDIRELTFALKRVVALDFNDGLLFNNDTDAIYAETGGGCGCKWYQLGCWFDCIFGPKVGPKALEALVDFLIDLLTK